MNGMQYYVHADGGYKRRHTVDVIFQGGGLAPEAMAANKETANVRAKVEWSYQEVKLYLSSMDLKRKIRVDEGAVGLTYICEMVLHNMRNCLYPNPISQFFGCAPPTIEECLHHKDVIYI